MSGNLIGISPGASITEEFAALWLRSAYELAWHSPDTSTQLAAVLLMENGERTVGINVPVSGYEFHDLEVSDNKYIFMEHAERNAIYGAARNGFSTFNGTLICPWAACHDCARAIVEAGISTVIRHRDAIERTPHRWEQSVKFGDQILIRGGVEIFEYEGKLNGREVLFDGQFWKP